MRPILRALIFVVLLKQSALGADYLKEIKPLLQHKCYSCHGALKQQGNLRLDTAEFLLKGGESGETIVPGKPGESYLIDVLTGDAGFRMPPENEGTPLSEEEIILIRDWIKAGAPQPEEEEPQTDPQSWWSYQPIHRPDLPKVRNPSWCRTEIDHFIAAARDQRELPMVEEADRATWLRRVFFDLIGLPPTLEEITRFVNDSSPDAYERVVDDLLARPQYGERWGRHWMDVWRYSDWYGSRGINEIRYSQRHIWRWRDWIVRSLNEDKGYDQMLREMLAADELPQTDTELLPATGYLGRNWYLFDRNVWMFETVERTGEAFLGMTFRCCRCHDHKFDPITQQEYYEFRAFFEPHDVRTDPISALTGTEKDAKAGQVLTDGIALVYDKNSDAPTYLFQRGDSRYPDESKALSPGVPAALGGDVEIQPVSLPVETWYPYLRDDLRETLIEKAEQEVAAAVRNWRASQTKTETIQQQLAEAKEKQSGDDSALEAPLIDETFDERRNNDWRVINGQWDWREGKLIQSAVTGFATLVSKKTLPVDLQIHLKYRTLSPGSYRSVGFSFDYQDQGNSQDVYTSTGDARQSVQAFHRVNGKQTYPQPGIVITPLKVGDEVELAVTVTGSQLTLDLNGERKLEYKMPVARREGKFALWVHQGAAEFLELKVTPLRESVETLALKEQQAVEGVELARMEMEVAHARQESLKKRLKAEVARYLDASSESMNPLMEDARQAELAAEVSAARLDLLKAGEDEKLKQQATQKLQVAETKLKESTGEYSPLGQQYPRTSTGRRLALAEWMVDSRNPRTARVAANHIWSRHFGRPLVETPENFGLNGRQPSHPELLNWLSAELMENGWRMKPLHRKIVLSSTYRLSSRNTLKAENDLRAIESDPDNRYLWRMNSRRMEAEIVRDALLSLSDRLDLKQGGPEIPESEGETNFRRSLYFRNTPNEKMLMLEVFDVADPNACYRRKESVVPHQSLALMNSGLAIDSARFIAKKISTEEDFVTTAYQTVLNRLPSMEEVLRCEEFLKQHSTLLEKEAQEKFSTGGTSTQAPAEDPLNRARENLIHVLLMHHEFVTIR